MPKQFFASIKTFNGKDCKSLFEHLCKHVCLKSVEEVKDLLDIDVKKDPDIFDLINLIQLYDMKVELKVYYEDHSVVDENPIEKAVKKAEETGVVPPPSDKHQALSDQAEEIKNPDLKDVNKIQSIIVPEEKIQKKKIDPNSIPDFG